MNQNDEAMTREIFGEPICCYSRAQAIEDGVLVDVSERARRAGIRYPTACTAGVWALIGTVPESCSVDESVRLAAVLTAMLAAIRRGGVRGTDRVHFVALGAALWAQCGPGDTAAPVITIMREGED
ncbi:DUF6573 family protein [Metallibacterium sp.]|uniref:DUF6573 family protein n=1 Tax=Metallibacterium sp. TaxID=2940281 RepID=UPI0026133DBE|nr:DUF6573 family protein [Metallibacterium sp.]